MEIGRLSIISVIRDKFKKNIQNYWKCRFDIPDNLRINVSPSFITRITFRISSRETSRRRCGSHNVWTGIPRPIIAPQVQCWPRRKVKTTWRLVFRVTRISDNAAGRHVTPDRRRTERKIGRPLLNLNRD